MKKLRNNIAAVFLSLLIVLPVSSFALEDAIIAVVNNEVITLKDLREYINTTYMSLTAQGHSEAEIERAMKNLEENGLNKLIEDKLILSHANEIGMTVRQELIDEQINEIKARYPSEEVFMEALLTHGGTMSDMRKKIEDQLKVKFVIDHKIRSKIYISPQEVTKFYNKNLDNFQMKERINLDSIFIAFGSNQIEAKKKAQKALDLIKQGEDFLEVAKQFSDAPSIGAVERGQLMPSIEKVVFHLPKDAPSDIVELETGYYIFRLTGRSSADIASLQDVKDQIRTKLYQTRFRELFLQWLDELKEDAFIEIKQ